MFLYFRAGRAHFAGFSLFTGVNTSSKNRAVSLWHTVQEQAAEATWLERFRPCLKHDSATGAVGCVYLQACCFRHVTPVVLWLGPSVTFSRCGASSRCSVSQAQLERERVLVWLLR